MPLILGLCLYGCGTTKSYDFNTVDYAGVSESALVILPVKFSGYVTTKVIDECSMLEELKISIYKYSDSYGLEIVPESEVGGITTEKTALLVEFEDVQAHYWHFSSFLPSSRATAKVTLMKDGSAVKEVRKNIRSSVALTACSRLEKIAKVAGKFSVKWALKNDV